ncbi:O-antigen ligase family protein [Patescibacteria group bacterium]|nr:O-antigen ligase family protein [Patescibacteria group bacterium]
MFNYLRKINKFLILLFLFLLPWQTRWIYGPADLNGAYWEYGTLSLYGTEILMWITILLFSLDRFARKEFWKKITNKESFKMRWPRLVAAVAILAYFSFLIWHSLNWEISYQFVLRLLGVFCFFVIIVNVGEAKKILVALWLSGLVQGFFALWQFFSQHVGANKWLGLTEQNARQLGASVIEFGDERWLRAYGSFGWPNALGIYLAGILMIGLWLYFISKNYKQKLLIILGQLIILSGLILSFSRGAWIAAVLGIVILFFVSKQNKLEIVKHVIYYTLIVSLFFVALKPLFLTRVNTVERLEQKSMVERQTQISEWKNIFSKNWLFGVGPGAYTIALYNENQNKPAWQYQPVHNVFLLMPVELGAIGFILYVSFFVFFIIKIRKHNIFFPLVAVLVVAGLFDHWLWSMYTGLILWWIIFAISFKKIQN